MEIDWLERLTPMPARARVHRTQEHEPRGKAVAAMSDASDHYLAFLQRLS
jgi:hypothetical protein